MLHLEAFDEYGGHVNMNGGRSFLVTFKGLKSKTAIPLAAGDSRDLDGTNSFVAVSRVSLSRALSGTYRIKVKDEWTTPILVNATAADVQRALEGIEKVDSVRVSHSTNNSKGAAFSYDISFPHYIGDAPNGYVPWTAGDIPPIKMETSNLSGPNFTCSLVTIENGTDPSQMMRTTVGFASQCLTEQRSIPSVKLQDGCIIMKPPMGCRMH